MSYMPIPGGMADVWVRRDIAESVDQDGGACWTCDERYVRTSKTLDECESDPEALWDEACQSATGSDTPTESERISALEDAAAELGAIVAGTASALADVQMAVAEIGSIVASSGGGE